jgi:4-amino-4-deoxy-L-arabinose transferase-like glycosyltransferase
MFPLSDPPPDLSWSGGEYADEGFWAQDARNLTLFGTFGADDWHDRYVSPLIFPLVTALFSLLGANLPAIRIWALLISAVSLFVFFKSFKKHAFGWLAFLLLSTCSILIAYQRIALLETASILCSSLVLLSWLHARSQDNFLWDIITGILLGMAYLTKGTQIFLIPAVIVATLWSMGLNKRFRTSVLWQILGIGFVIIPWFLLIYSEHSQLIMQYNSYYSSQQGDSLKAIFKNILLQPFFIYFNRLPLIFLPSWIFFIQLILRKKTDRYPDIIKLSSIWAGLGLLFFMPMGYRPLRYYVPLIPPMAILASWWIFNRSGSGAVPGESSSNQDGRRGLQASWLLLPVFANAAPLLDKWFAGNRFLGIGALPGFSIEGAVSTILAGSILAMLIVFKGMNRERIIVIALALICVDLVRVGNWQMHRTYQIRNASLEMAAILPISSVVAGQWAPELCLGTPFTAIPMWKGFVNFDNPFRKFGITHVLSWDYPLGNEYEHQKEWFPQEMSRAKIKRTFIIRNTNVLLLEMPMDTMER